MHAQKLGKQKLRNPASRAGMSHLLPNATAEAVGLTIPGRSSSRRDHSKRSSKHRKYSSVDTSRDEVLRRLRSPATGNREANTNERVFFGDPSIIRSQALKSATSSTSTSSSSLPISQYKNNKKPAPGCSGGHMPQTGVRIRTFRPTDIPDSHNSPDISAHPANSLSESPVDPLLGFPTFPALEIQPPNRPPRPQVKLASEPRPNPTSHISLFPSSLIKHTEDTSVTTKRAPAVAHETVAGNDGSIVHSEITRDEHYHASSNHVKPVNEMFYAPAQHFATGVQGKVIKIPDALGEGLAIAKDREPKEGVMSMGWE